MMTQSIYMTKLLVLSKPQLTDISSHQKWHYALINYLSTIYYSYFPHPSAHCSTDSTWFLSSHTFISFHLPTWILAPLPGAQSEADWQDFYQKSSYKYQLGREKEKNGEGWMGGRGNKNRSPVSSTNIWWGGSIWFEGNQRQRQARCRMDCRALLSPNQRTHLAKCLSTNKNRHRPTLQDDLWNLVPLLEGNSDLLIVFMAYSRTSGGTCTSSCLSALTLILDFNCGHCLCFTLAQYSYIQGDKTKVTLRLHF